MTHLLVTVVSVRPEGACMGSEAGSAAGIVRLLRDRPEFGSLPPHVLRVLAWCCGYSSEDCVPTREDILRAMTALASPARML